MRTYMIFSERLDTRAPGGTVLDATGLEVRAESKVQALEKAHWQGIAWDLGRNPRYVGLVAKLKD
jgi:hypothetical protein